MKRLAGVGFRFTYNDGLDSEMAPLTLVGNSRGSLILSGESNDCNDFETVAIMLSWEEADALVDMLLAAREMRERDK